MREHKFPDMIQNGIMSVQTKQPSPPSAMDGGDELDEYYRLLNATERCQCQVELELSTPGDASVPTRLLVPAPSDDDGHAPKQGEGSPGPEHHDH